MKCRKCGFELEGAAKFCPNCGEKTKEICPKCNAELLVGVKTCPFCGSPVAEGIEDTETKAVDSVIEKVSEDSTMNNVKKRSTRSKKGFVIVGIIAILGCVGMIFGDDSGTSSGKQDNVTETNIQVEQPAVTDEDIKLLKESIDEYLDNSSNKQAIKTIKKFDKDYVMSELSKKILEATQEKYSADLSTFVTIRKCQDLYEKAFGESCPELDKNSELAEKLSNLYREQEDLKNLYPFSIEKGATEYQHGEVYVVQRLENSYSDNLLGAISKEIDSYKTQNDSYWVVNNVEYNTFYGQYPGDENYIVYSTETNPFSKMGVYNIAYYSDGKTITTIDINGFEAETPVLYLIDESQLQTDWNRYQNSKNESEKLIKEIADLNRGGTDSKDNFKNNDNRETKAESKTENVISEGEYILPESDRRYLTESDLAGLDQAMLRLARNEIYARHGRLYETKDLNAYFSQQSWYHGYLSAGEFNNSVLNEYERANIELIRSIENSMSEGGEANKSFNNTIFEAVFPSDWTQRTSWHSDSTGYYMIPDATDGEPVIYFSVANDTISASLAYGVLIDSVEQTANGGLVCIGRMYPYSKSFGTGQEDDYNGTVQVTWDSFESIDFPSIKMIDGHQMTDVSMIADDYHYYGPLQY